MSGRTLLGVWAHPDDEAYLTAGLMLEHVARGDRVVLVTATLGERGTSDAVAWPPSRLAPHRHAELIASLAVLGVHDLRLLGFEDGGCDTVDGTDLVIEQIEDVRPDVIVTFGPDGMTGHPDHGLGGAPLADRSARRAHGHRRVSTVVGHRGVPYRFSLCPRTHRVSERVRFAW